MNLALDFGNSRLKAAVFNQRKPVLVKVAASFTLKTIQLISAKYGVKSSILSSVIEPSKSIVQFLQNKTWFINFDASTPTPIHNFYKSPKTLGTDRLAGVIGAHSLFPKKNLLIISAGTCITYDAIDAKGNYYGGNITPGLEMRLKAMNTFTARLPLVEKEMTKELFGRDTAGSLLTGVMRGTSLEMKGFIHDYRKKYARLKVLITGGDAPFFETIPECKIFAVPHLVLYGLNEILLLNYAKKD